MLVIVVLSIVLVVTMVRQWWQIWLGSVGDYGGDNDCGDYDHSDGDEVGCYGGDCADGDCNDAYGDCSYGGDGMIVMR